MRRFERRLRLATGLIIACFVTGHFLNHSLGVVSIDAMDRLRTVLAAWWRSAPGTVLLYGALLTHFAAALLIPSLALAGFAAAGNEIWPRIEGAGGLQVFCPELGRMSAPERLRLAEWREELELAFWSLLGATLLARWLRTRIGGTY